MYLSVAVCMTSSLVVMQVAALALRTHFLMVAVIKIHQTRRSSHDHITSKKTAFIHIQASHVEQELSSPSHKLLKDYGSSEENIWEPQSILYNIKDVIIRTDISPVHSIVTSR